MADRLSPQHDAEIREQIGDAQAASAGLVVSLAKSVRDCREHEHPTWEDLYCLNLTSYMGDRMAPVLRRLLDAEAELAAVRAERDHWRQQYRLVAGLTDDQELPTADDGGRS